MAGRAGRQLKGPLALAAVVAIGSCSRGGGAPEDPAGPAPAAAPPVRTAGTPETTCSDAIRVRVAAIRRETADSIRVELAVTNRASAQAWVPGSAEVGAAEAAVRALEGLSLLSGDGRRRLFALRSSSGERVGTPAQTPPPGDSRVIWALFPAADGPLSLILPGCAPVAGLTVAPAVGPARPEP
jgi:hypothetical protein